MFVASDIERMALSLGIDACGVAPARVLMEDVDYLREWTTAGYHGSMDYMARNMHLREDVTQLLPDCRTVVVCLFNYYKVARQTTDAPRIAQCGLSKEDYHIYVKQKLEELCSALCIPLSATRIFCDSAPVLERRWAVEAGLGWIGKNHLFIHPTLGSFVHIGVLLLQEECDVYAISMDNRCGDCTLCLQACPTGAIRGTHFDARKCVSYLTIERKEPLEEKYRGVVRLSLYGCDRCQEVCPYNQHVEETRHTALQANESLLTMTAADWRGLSRRQKIRRLRRLAKE